jgi:hypothetical protein
MLNPEPQHQQVVNNYGVGNGGGGIPEKYADAPAGFAFSGLKISLNRMRLDKAKAAAVNDLLEGYAGNCQPSGIARNVKGEIVSLVLDHDKTFKEMIEDIMALY